MARHHLGFLQPRESRRWAAIWIKPCAGPSSTTGPSSWASSAHTAKPTWTSRARWTEHVAREAEARGFSWAYWEFCAGFGIYHADIKMWEMPLVNALVP
jgi:hypothetical protein